jgi:hypothetical protein
VNPTTGEDRKRREDIHRILIPTGGSITYRVDGPIKSWRLILFRENGSANVEAEQSSDGVAFSAIEATAEVGPEAGGDYGYLQMVQLSSRPLRPGAKFLRLKAVGGPIEISRVEIRYGGG